MSDGTQMSDSQQTRASLLLRLPDGADFAAWNEFSAIYAPLAYRVARRQGLQPADADDLVQEVMAAVSRSIEQWLAKPDRGPFRAWLYRIARNIAINFLTRPKHRQLAKGGSDVARTLAEVPAPSDVSDAIDSEYRREVFRWASRQIRARVNEKTWQAFWLTTVAEQTIPAAARELELSVGSVYVARSRIMASLREMVSQFNEQLDQSDGSFHDFPETSSP